MIVLVMSINYKVHAFSNFSGNGINQFLNSNLSELIQYLSGPLFTIVIIILNGLKTSKNTTESRITEVGEHEEKKKLQEDVELQAVELQKVEFD